MPSSDPSLETTPLPPSSGDPFFEDDHGTEYHSPSGPRPWIIGSIITGIGGFLLLITAYYGQYLATSVAPSLPRATVHQSSILSLPVSPAQWPIKVELCRERLVKRSCVTLSPSKKANRTVVRIPGSYPLGRGILSVQQRGRNGKLTGTVLYRRPVAVAAALTDISPSP